jgi:hypothetical protein
MGKRTLASIHTAYTNDERYCATHPVGTRHETKKNEYFLVSFFTKKKKKKNEDHKKNIYHLHNPFQRSGVFVAGCRGHT